MAATGLALFDFDGTITAKDSLPDFIQYAVGRVAYWTGLLKLSPMLAAYTFGMIPNHVAKERLIANFFTGWDEEQFQQTADQYSLQQLDRIVKPEAIERMRRHQAQGDRVVVVSASMESWLKGWCRGNNVELLATCLEIKDGKLTGKFATKNCYGIEKVNRINEAYTLSDFSIIYAYGDSRGDREMLEIATVKHYRKFS